MPSQYFFYWVRLERHRRQDVAQGQIFKRINHMILTACQTVLGYFKAIT